VIHDLATGRTLNTGLARGMLDSIPTKLEFANERLVVPVSERDQGRDLDQDGDQDDYVLHVVRAP
jgi:hypothetical protein